MVMKGGSRLSFVNASDSVLISGGSPTKQYLGAQQISSESGATGNMGVVEEVEDENQVAADSPDNFPDVQVQDEGDLNELG